MMIIAEIGLNHNGSIDIAKELITNAIWAGANAVKFQTFWDLGEFEEYELTKDEWINIINFCKEMNITFLSAPHTMDAIDFLDDYVSIHKIASRHINNEEFIKKVASKGKPILLSTGSIVNRNGMATDEEIEKALSWIDGNEVTLLHCVSKYPCIKPHYSRIEELKRICDKVGLSDHSKNIAIPRNIEVIEKHFMLDSQNCIDKPVSLTPTEFREMAVEL